MSAGKFHACHTITAKWEGGWSDHADDPGGKTMYGVTEAVFHAWLKRKGAKLRPVRSIKKYEALAIYKAGYWGRIGAEGLAPGVDLASYDAAVNSGVSRARRWLIASVGASDPAVTVRRLCANRLSFMQGLRIWKTFGRGWARRVADIEVNGVVMAQQAAGRSPVGIRIDANDEVDKAASAKKRNEAGAGGATVGGGGSTQIDWTGLGDFAGAVAPLLIVAAAVVVFVLIWKSRVHKARAEAYGNLADYKGTRS